MRHFSTLLAAILVAPLSWLLLAAGQDRSARAFAGPLAAGDLLPPALCLAGAGLLLGLLATLRISPLGAMLAGAAYSGSYLAVLFDPRDVLAAVPQRLSLAGHTVDPITPLRTGTALLLGALLLVATFSIGRWRRRPAVAAPVGPVVAGPEIAIPAAAMPAVAMRSAPLAERAVSGTTGWHTVIAEPAEMGPAEMGPADIGLGAEGERPGQHRAGPDEMPRRPERPRGANRVPGAYESVNNAGDRWVGNRQPAWPYPEHPRTGSRTIWE